MNQPYPGLTSRRSEPRPEREQDQEIYEVRIFGLVFWPQNPIYLAVLRILSAMSLFLFTAVAECAHNFVVVLGSDTCAAG